MKLGVAERRRSWTSRACRMARSRRPRAVACGSGPPSATATSPPTRPCATVSRALPGRAGGRVGQSQRATVGGNLLQRTRCAIFQDRRSRATSGARVPVARRARAITATSPCSAIRSTASRRTPRTWRSRSPRSTPSSTSAGRRGAEGGACGSVPAARQGAGARHVSGPADLIIAVELPAAAIARRSAYRKARDRASSRSPSARAVAVETVAARSATSASRSARSRTSRGARGGRGRVTRGARDAGVVRGGRRRRARHRAAARQRVQAAARPRAPGPHPPGALPPVTTQATRAVGAPHTRAWKGGEKVTGAARCAVEHPARLAYAWIVQAAVARGEARACMRRRRWRPAACSR